MSAVQKSAEWHQQRKFRLTASDFAAATGISPYKSRQQLWREKTGRSQPFQGNDATAWGELNERNAINAYEVFSGDIVVPCGLVLHPLHDWLGVSPDGLVRECVTLEAKCPMSKVHEGVPTHYLPQAFGAMEITARPFCDFISWTPEEYRIWRIERSEFYWLWMFPFIEDFWKQVIEDVEPPRRKKPEYEGQLTIERIK